jgi:hypothetical protein
MMCLPCVVEGALKSAPLFLTQFLAVLSPEVTVMNYRLPPNLGCVTATFCAQQHSLRLVLLNCAAGAPIINQAPGGPLISPFGLFLLSLGPFFPIS